MAAALLGALVVGAVAVPAHGEETPPFEVVGGLIDTSDTTSLGLPQAENAETITIFAPGDDDLQFNHGVVLLPFQGKLFAQWQSSLHDEDAPETIVRYATSEDGETWSEPVDLTEPREDGYTSSGGWWTDGETLVAYLNVWPESLEPRGGYTEYVTSTDGVTWSDPQRVTDDEGEPVDGIIEQDVHALPDGRVLTAFHVQPGLFAQPFYSDDPLGVAGWTQGEFENQPNTDDMSRELEPSWYVREDGAVVMVFRDQGGNTYRKLASVSMDRGETWSPSVLTNVPDSRTKQSAGNLPDGTSYLVGNPTGTRDRLPLSILLSADGAVFDEGFTLRDSDDLQPRRYEGQYKSAGYSYPKSVTWGDHLYVAYGTNKEDAELTRVPLADISLGDDGGEGPGTDDAAETGEGSETGAEEGSERGTESSESGADEGDQDAAGSEQGGETGEDASADAGGAEGVDDGSDAAAEGSGDDGADDDSLAPTGGSVVTPLIAGLVMFAAGAVALCMRRRLS